MLNEATKEVMCWSVIFCPLYYFRSYGQIFMKFCGGFGSNIGTVRKCLAAVI